MGVVACRGEFDGVVIEIKTEHGYEPAELTVDAAREMIAALTAAVDYLDRV